jgi:uncharacterized protein YdcH (DUF465 family)
MSLSEILHGDSKTPAARRAGSIPASGTMAPQLWSATSQARIKAYIQPLTHRSLSMFPEYRDLISKLKTSDHHFGRLFEQHNSLDQKIKNMESHIEAGSHEVIEALKKEKLLLKDQLYGILRKAEAV